MPDRAAEAGPRDTVDPLNLPHGFHDVEEAALSREEMLLDAFARRARQIGCAPLRTSPIGHAATFRRGCHTTGDKVFSFRDRKGRELMLTPDSTPAILRWYLAQAHAEPARVYFRSPLFRYRRQRNRHFQQIGFTLINEPAGPADAIDEGALLLARTALRAFVLDLGVALEVRITDVGAWRAILHRMGCDDGQCEEVLHALRPLGPEERRQWIESRLPGGPDQDALLALLHCRGPAAPGNDPTAASLARRAVTFARECVAGFGVQASVGLDDLHSSELQDGIGFAFFTSSGERFADGGCYGLYGKRFDARISTLKSFASGVEFFAARDLFAVPVAPTAGILILEVDAAVGLGRSIAEELMAAQLSVVHRHCDGSLRNTLRHVGPSFRWLIVVGRTEEETGLLAVRDLRQTKIERVQRSILVPWLRDRETAEGPSR